MLDIRFIKENMDTVRDMLKKRNQESFIKDVEKMINQYDEKKKILQETESLRNQRKMKSQEIGKVKSQGGDIEAVSKEVKEINEIIKTNEDKLNVFNQDIDDVLLGIPNLLDERVPVGKDESFNKVIHDHGDKPEFSFKPKPHWDIAEQNDLVDFQRGTKLTGSRFILLKSKGAQLERALINFMLDIQTNDNEYQEMSPPFIVNEKTMTGTGQLPKFKEDLFKLEGMDYYLIPTAEVPLTNIHSNEILAENDLPLHYTAYTPCFRSEAGSWGKDTRGLIRLHQFNKVELVKIVHPDNSNDELEKMLKDAEKILKLLNIHYRVVALSSGDIGFASQYTYDIEVWLPGADCYREISSCSNCHDFQARRANIKYKDKEGNKDFVHTLNGSGLAVGRTMVAILENFQTEDGGFIIPEILKKYM